MSSNRTLVRLTGHIRGNGLEAACTIQAEKVSLPGSSDFEFANFNIVSTSQKLPEGIYELTVNGKTQTIRRANKHWLSAES